jgi:hypothetical protein
MGNTTALLPAAEFELTYWNVGLYGEMEYAIVLNENGSNFFSYWGELYYSPWEWMWFGMAAQRIRLNERDLMYNADRCLPSAKMVYGDRVLF